MAERIRVPNPDGKKQFGLKYGRWPTRGTRREAYRIHRTLRSSVVMKELAKGATVTNAAKAAGITHGQADKFFLEKCERIANMTTPEYDEAMNQPYRYVPVSEEGALAHMILELRMRGSTYHDIASRVEVSESRAKAIVWSELDRIDADEWRSADRARRMHIERLEMLFERAFKKGDLAVALKILERQAKVLGLDAPVKIDIESKLRAIAEAEGLDPDAAVKEVEAIMAEMKL